MSHVHAKVVKNIKNVVDVNVEKTPVEPFAHWCFFCTLYMIKAKNIGSLSTGVGEKILYL